MSEQDAVVGVIEPKKALTAAEIEATEDLELEWVDIPEWKGGAYIRGLTAQERDEFEGSLLVGSGKNQKMNTANMRAKLVRYGLVDEAGKQIFSPAQLAKLAAKNSTPITRLFDQIRRKSGMGDRDVEELAGNSESALSAAS